MLLSECPHCRVSHIQATTRFTDSKEQGVPAVRWSVVRCQNPLCQQLVLVEHDQQGLELRLYPFAGSELDPAVIESVELRDDFREATLCLAAGCYKASLVMSRRVLQRSLKGQGCTQKKLVAAIDYALKEGILREAFRAIATEIREYGNLGAHPDDDQLKNANRESAEKILSFARLLINEFYEIPAAAKRLRENRGGE